MKFWKSMFYPSWRPLCVLLWRHLKEAQHRWYAMLWRILQACSLFCALFLIWQFCLIKMERDMPMDFDNPTRIIYKPHNYYINALMKKVLNELHKNDPVFGLRFENMWEMDFSKTRNIEASINPDKNTIFVNIKDEGLFSNKFSYTIMFNGPSKNSRPKILKGLFRNLYRSDEIASRVIGTVQWAIDKTYIEQVDGREIEHVLRLSKTRHIQFLHSVLSLIQSYIIFCTAVAPLPVFMKKSSNMTRTKLTGLQDLVRLSGASPNVFRISNLLDVAANAFLSSVACAAFLKVTSNPILPKTSFLIVVITITLYFTGIVVLAFLSSIFSHDYNYANSWALLLFVSTVIVSYEWHSLALSSVRLQVFVTCLLPHGPMFLFWDKVCYMELIGEGVTFSNIYIRHGYHLPVLVIWVIFLLHIFFLMTLAWYMNLVIPANYGITKKWNFIFKKRVLLPKKKKVVNFHVTAEQTTHIYRSEIYFERGPPHADINVKIVNLVKVFRGHQRKVLNKICLDVYKGEVTVILGQCGSGKTTLVNIITGMQEATEGNIYINGLDNVRRLHELQEIVELCPQANVVVPSLTVRENIIFFGMLHVKNSLSIADDLISQLALTDYADSFYKTLSQGVRRCLQVACTIASGSDVLVLDEPTSGMDTEIRLKVWKLIMTLRGKKTIIMTTSLLTEADILGDRIAILNKGRVQCYASPSFLKKTLGIGLNITVTVKDSKYIDALRDLVENALHDVICKFQGTRRISFMLPQNEQDKFEEFFDILESKKREFEITAIQVGRVMEKLYFDVLADESLENVASMGYEPSWVMQPISRCTLMRRKFILLTQRLLRFLWVKKYQFIIMQVVLPLTCLTFITLTTNNNFGHSIIFQKRSDGVTKMVYNLGPYRRSALTDTIDLQGVDTFYSQNIDEDLDDIFEDSMAKTIGLRMNVNDSSLFVPLDPRKLSKSVNMFSNLFLNLHMPYLNKSIATTYMSRKVKLVEPKNVFLCSRWVYWVNFMSLLALTPLIMLSIMERDAGTRNIYITAGCSPIQQWSTKLVTHWSIYTVLVPIPLVILTKLLDMDNTLNGIEFLGSLLFLLIVFAPAFLAHLYVLSFILSDYSGIGQIYVISLTFGNILPLLISILDVLGGTVWIDILDVLMWIFGLLNPLFLLIQCTFHLVALARLNAYCNLNKHLCPNFEINEEQFSAKVCCESKSNAPFNYMDMWMNIRIGAIVIHFVVYAVIVILLENKIIQSFWIRVLNRKYKKPRFAYMTSEILSERTLADERVIIKQFSNEMVIVQRVYKNFHRLKEEGHRLDAVRGISFMVKRGECIGLMGKERSGKSTLLQILAGRLVPTKGNIWIGGHSLKDERSKYLSQVAIATNSGGADKFLTGRQNLILICQLSGLTLNMSERIAEDTLRNMGLFSVRDVPVRKYNNDCLSRFNLSVVEVLYPAVAIIDEPFINVDYVARPLVVGSLERMIERRITMIVAEASLDWYLMESIYDRLAIINRGQLAALGHADAIYQSLTAGYSVHLKLKLFKTHWVDDESVNITTPNDVVRFQEEVLALKNDFIKEFETSHLTEEHLCMLYFYVSDDDGDLLYTDMFKKMQKLLRNHKHVLEDYSLHSITLDEVFWRVPYRVDHC